MPSRDLQCANCGHYFNSGHPYFSEDFARAFLDVQHVGVSWCLHCGHISEYRQAKILFVKTPFMKLARTYSIEKLAEQEYFKAPYGSMGGFFGVHFLRLMWHSIEARAKLDHGLQHTPTMTMQELLRRLPPLHAAFAIFAVSTTAESLQLEEQLAQAVYRSESGWEFNEQAMQTLRDDESLPNRDAVMEILTELGKRT